MDDYAGLEQLERRVEWLDNERRNDKTNLASMQNRLTVLETENTNLRKQIKELEILISQQGNQISSLDKYEGQISRLNNDLSKQIRESGERANLNLDEASKRQKLELDSLKNNLNKLYELTEQIEPLREELKISKAEDTRLSRLIEEQKARITEVSRFDEDYRRSLQMVEENRRQEAKRITEVQGEITSMRKRVDETRNRIEGLADNFRSFDTRITELQGYEKDRKEDQSRFIDTVNSSLVEKERSFKNWEGRFQELDTINTKLNTQIEALEEARLSISKSLAQADKLTQQFERRINEISEVQRLNDERFRQEWASFKSDDIKRWANYMLTYEEQNRETGQEIADLNRQIEEIKDISVRNQDAIEALNRETVRHVQMILRAYQDSIQNVATLLDNKA
jgi:chromosome segregation ATPase